MRTIILILALCLSATAQTYIFGGGKAAAIVGPQATILPASCVTEGLLLRLTADDGVNKRGLYYCVNGTYTRSGFTGTEGRLLRFGATNAVGQTTGLYEDGSGNVGIGTTNPTQGQLVVNKNIVANQQNANLVTLGSVTGSESYPGIWFGSATPSLTNFAFLADVGTPQTIINAPSGGQIDLRINNSSVIRALSTGNVGIGTTGPEALLHLAKSAGGAVGPTLLLQNTAGNYGDKANIDFMSAGDSDARSRIQFRVEGVGEFGGAARGDIGFFTGSVGSSAPTEKVSIKSNGNVGIGTTAPTAKLDVPGGIAGAWAAQTEGGCNTYADLAVDGTLNTKVTSASYNFVAADVGSWLDITAGGAWTGGRYVITAVAANAATLASSPAAVSSTTGTFILGRGKIVHVEGATDDTIRICRKASSVFGWQAM